MKTETLIYRNTSICLVPEFRKGKNQYWIFINREPLTFVSNKERALRIACNFIDVVKGEGFKTTKTVYISKEC